MRRPEWATSRRDRLISRWRADRDHLGPTGRDDRGETWQLSLVGESRSNRDYLDAAFQEVLRVRRVYTPGCHELDAREWPRHCGEPVRSDHSAPRFAGLMHSFQGSDCARADRLTLLSARRDDGAECVDIAIGLDWHFDAVDTEVPGGAGDGHATLGAESPQNCHQRLSVEQLGE